MKKILYSVFMLATMVLAACSSEDTTEPDVKRGMVLKANVEDTDTRATITDNEGKWKFAFATDDKVKVGNDEVESYYTFKNNGTVFASTDAKQTTTAATWYAYFPGETIDLRNQSGDFADVANNYALAGETASATTGSDGLTVTMKAKAAVLRIVGVNKDDILDISVKTADDDKYVSGLTAVKNSAGFSVQKSDAKVSLLSKQGAGVYYVVVPADVKLSVYNGNRLIKATKAEGLKAGKYYTLATGDTKGQEYATINGVEVKKDWVQLWPGGPKFATENVENQLNFTDACKTGDAYVWGKNWRTPKLDEMEILNTGSTKGLVKYENTIQEGKAGVMYTGLMPGYTDRTLFFSSEQSSRNMHGWTYWTSTEKTDGSVVAFTFFIWGDDEHGYDCSVYPISPNRNTNYFVLPVLAK